MNRLEYLRDLQLEVDVSNIRPRRECYVLLDQLLTESLSYGFRPIICL